MVGAIDMAEKYGCDTARLYTLFAAPPEKDLEWSEQGIEGCARFLQRVFRLVDRHAAALRGVSSSASRRGGDLRSNRDVRKEKALLRKAHQTLRRVTHDFEARWHFNTSVALIMELVNALQAQEPLEEGARPEVVKEVLELLTLMLAPMAPHLAEELWEMLGHMPTALDARAWPEYIRAACRRRAGGNRDPDQRAGARQDSASIAGWAKKNCWSVALAIRKIGQLLRGRADGQARRGAQ